MKTLSCKLLVLGAGPGGYVCAIRAGQLGINTIVVEQANPGGTCLNVGCIPSKAIIHAAEEFHKALRTSTQSAIGLTTTTPVLDYKQTLHWKDNIVNRLNQGVLRHEGV